MNKTRLCLKGIFLLSGLLLTILSSAQKKADVKISGIPYQLFWENNPVGYDIKGDSLVIEAGEKTDMFRDPNVTYNTDNAPKLLFTPDNDFVLIASIKHDFKEKWDGGALVIKSDSLNWVKFCFEKDYTLKRRVVSVVTKNISDDCNSVSLTTNKVFYKVAKADNVITLYYSPDGTDWLLVRHFQFDNKGKLYVGFLAQSPLGKRCRVVFSDIIYQHKKIRDPYLGE